MRKAKSHQMTLLPLAMKDRVKTELPALVALTAIGEPWFSEQHQSDLLAVALVVRQLAPEDSLQAQCSAALQRLCDEPLNEVHKLDVATNLSECLPWLQSQPNSNIQRALAAVVAARFPLAA